MMDTISFAFKKNALVAYIVGDLGDGRQIDKGGTSL